MKIVRFKIYKASSKFLIIGLYSMFVIFNVLIMKFFLASNIFK